MASLSAYPNWKLLELDNFRGYFSETLRYLDNLQPKPSDPYSELGYDQDRKQLAAEPESMATQRARIAHDFNEHVQRWCGGIGEKKKETDEEKQLRRKGEVESYKALDKKYPHLNIMAQVEGEKRFKGIA